MIKTLVISNLFRRYCSINVNNMKYLNVAEKHDAAKTISGYLSNGTATRREGYSVYNKIFDFTANVKGKSCKMVMTSVSGHVMEYEFLPSYKGWRTCDPHQLFDAPMRKSCSEDSEKIRRTLEREIKSCQGLIIWTDCDREGENIGFEVIDICKAVKPNITVFRAKFSEITAASVRRALANLTQPDIRQSQAVDVRMELDLRTGAAFTRLQTLHLQKVFPQQIEDKLISYGSCQIPTLGFVAERYKEIEAFVPEPFWKLRVTHTIDDLTVEFLWDRNRLFDKEAVEDYLMLCLADPRATVESVVTKPKSKWRPNPMDTVELEKLGSRKLKINAKNVMTIAEKLYTQGIISYPRTETNMFSPEMDLRPLVQLQTDHPDWGRFASRVLEWGPNPRNGNKSDQAHPPIHPTKFTTSLTGNEQRIYELIVRHFLACVSKDAVGSETVVKINIAGEKFHATGLCIFERNYLDVYPYDKWNAKQIHKYENGQVFDPTEISMVEGTTTAPPLLTEADLIALMEKHGIGTDATHAEHIDKIKERGYIGEVERGLLVPGTIGMGLYEGYDAIELPLAKPMLRAEFELDLKKICAGERNPKEVLREQISKYKEAYKIITEKLRALDEKVGNRIQETPHDVPEEEDNPIRVQEVFPCPKCGNASMILKQKKDSNGYFLGCACFPQCKNTIWFSEDIKEVTLSDTHCNRCGPAYKTLDFKFKRNNYLALLNATSNVYNTCLGCDSNFRDIFEINIDCVKRVGSIVTDRSPSNSGDYTIRPAPSSNVNRNQASSATNVPSNSRNQRNIAISSNRPQSESVSRSISNSSTNHTSRNTSDNNIRRNYSTSNSRQGWDLDSLNSSDGSPNDQTKKSASEVNESLSIQDYFNDDDFDDLMLMSDVEPTVNTVANTDRRPPGRGLNSNSSTENERDGCNSRRPPGWDSNSNSTLGNQRSGNSDKRPFAWGSKSSLSVGNQRDVDNGRRPSGWDLNLDSSIGSSSYGNNDRRPIEWGSNSTNSSLTNQRGGNNNKKPFTWGSNTNPSPGNQKGNETDDDNDRRSFGWGSNSKSVESSKSGWIATSPKPSHAPPTNSRDLSPRYSLSWPQNDTIRWGRNAWDLENRFSNASNSVVKCSGCRKPAKELTVRKDGPNQGRRFYVCPKDNRCKYFQWADEIAQDQVESNERQLQEANNFPQIICTGCNIPAKQLTVRKEGPNKGRLFYTCSNNENRCEFFKWADENENPNEQYSRSEPTSSISWGSGSSRSSNPDNPQPKKRKCGFCREEGHTKLKCPRRGM